MMRPRALRRRLALMAVGAVLAGSALGTGIARADTGRTVADEAMDYAPTICRILDGAPTIDGVETVGDLLMGDGLTPKQAAAATVIAVSSTCPRNMKLLTGSSSSSEA